MNSVTLCPPKTQFFNYHTPSYIPDTLNILYIPIHPHSARFPIPFHYRSCPKKSIHISLSHHLFPASRTYSPPALDVIIFIHSFHRHCILFHRKRSSIGLTKTKSTQRVRYYVSCHKNYLIWLVPSGFGIFVIPSHSTLQQL